MESKARRIIPDKVKTKSQEENAKRKSREESYTKRIINTRTTHEESLAWEHLYCDETMFSMQNTFQRFVWFHQVKIYCDLQQYWLRAILTQSDCQPEAVNVEYIVNGGWIYVAGQYILIIWWMLNISLMDDQYRGEYFSEKSIFLHGPQKWPCTRMQEPLVPGQ